MNELDHDTLAPPFDRIFHDHQWSERFRQLLVRTLRSLGVTQAHHPLCVMSLGRSKLNVTYGNWLVLGIRGRYRSPRTFSVALLEPGVFGEQVRASGAFVTSDEGEPTARVYSMSVEHFERFMSDHSERFWSALEDTMSHVRQRFSTWSSSPYKWAHKPQLFDAAMSADTWHTLMCDGVRMRPGTHYWWTDLVPGDASDAGAFAVPLSEVDAPSAHRTNLRRIDADDVLIHHVDGSVAALSIATGKVVLPATDEDITADHMLPAVTVPLTVAIPIEELPHDLRKLAPAAFNLDGRPRPGPAWPLPDHVGRRLVALASPHVPADAQDRFDDASEDDLRRSILAKLVREGTRIVKIAPGHGGSAWEECLRDGVMCIGWDDVGDLGSFSDFDDFCEAFVRRYPYDGNQSAAHRAARELWTLMELAPGDLVLANRGKNHILGIGIVGEGGYVWRQDRPALKHTVAVEWDASFAQRVPPQSSWGVSTIADLDREQVRRFISGAAPGSVWIFQSHPRNWNLVELLDEVGEGAIIDHPVSRYVPEMQPGDTVLLWSSGALSGIRALGTIVDQESADAEASTVAVRVDSILEDPVLRDRFVRHAVLATSQIIQSPQGTSFRVSDEEWAAVQGLLDEGPAAEAEPRATVAAVADGLGIPLAELERWLRGIERRRQAILYGPPGTGKTYAAMRIAQYLVSGGDGVVELVQFHPAYTYEDFIQGLRPAPTSDGRLSYEIKEGRFQSFLRRAAARTGTSVLVIDEINRANIPRVFGELMYLLEYRDESVPLATGGELGIPASVRILATMNTADRSIALVDHALRRRFAFLPLRPQFEVLRKYHAGGSSELVVERLIDVLQRLHTAIGDANFHVGISYFLVPDLQAALEDIWRTEIEPYLEELFFDREDPLGEFTWARVRSMLHDVA
jgi:hypothetical protein